ncbi:uncharacterized protein LOC135477074 [Liolophura sinensis]|uniref:uncharacterized protein LOC135477074 n=1 Tax=Liolophura sinensis TaxID=3198878 RepID=UPI0031589DB0
MPLVEYRMCIRVLGNYSAIATYGLRKIATKGEESYGKDTKEFVERDFYVDDGITPLTMYEGEVDLLQRTRQSLKTGGNLRLRKIASNSVDAMDAFPATELGKDLRGLDLGSDHLPMQRSLGLLWENSDNFTFKASSSDKSYTRRGILSSVNSLYDPLGFVAPVSLQGK